MSQDKELSAYEQAKGWLLDYLNDGKPHLAGEVFIRGGEAGHAENLLRAAAKRNGVKVIDACLGYGRRSDVAVLLWQLPGERKRQEAQTKRPTSGSAKNGPRKRI